jgi:hypothetical protein
VHGSAEMDNTILLWNGGLSLVLGLIAYIANEKFKKLGDVETLLNQTRVEVARDNVTKAEVERITEHIDQRFNRLEEKIDRLIQKG